MTGPPLQFSPRQSDIIAGIENGESYKEIGERLNISPHTVRTVVIRIANKIPDFAELPPRWKILAYTKAREWALTHNAA